MLRWLPWKYLVRRFLVGRGFVDPFALIARLESFGRPSEVAAPVELLRAGAVFQARGLMNARAIQYNLDWIWPYWVQRQFDPRDTSFIPRAFSFSHVNLTHRNWTAVGLPGCNALPIVDPRGLVTPFFDAWSLDAWLLLDDGRELLPPTATECRQALALGENVRVDTETTLGEASARVSVDVALEGGAPRCRVIIEGRADADGWLCAVLRPFNPEGVSFIHRVTLENGRRTWRVDTLPCIEFDAPVERHAVSNYEHGDVHLRLIERDEAPTTHCHVGMVSAAAMFRLRKGTPRSLRIAVDLTQDPESRSPVTQGDSLSWTRALEPTARLKVPDERFQFLYDAAVRSLILHSPKDAYPGPYTYKRFWFRDAAYILHALLCAGALKRVKRGLESFAERQTLSGYFHSQEGEWDSNGQALWILWRFCELGGVDPPQEWRKMVAKGAHWIERKRRKAGNGDLHEGLLPAGFSAEHLGNNDTYYWDDFWGIAGLRAAASMMRWWGDEAAAKALEREGGDFMAAVERSVARSRHIRRHPGIPASPYRRMDAGAIGSIVAAYPLRLWAADDSRLLAAVDWMTDNCIVHGGFFQDMAHSGINAYLTLHLAQALLRAGDGRFFDLVRAVADLASPTGQWPEAVHPLTLGGCMGDGHHVWASAEWVMMARNAFVREEEGALILASGVPSEWLSAGEPIEFGPAPTPYGFVSVRVLPGDPRPRVEWDPDWRAEPPRIEVRLPGFEPVVVEEPGARSAEPAPREGPA